MDTQLTKALIKEVEKLDNNVPDGIIRDADSILANLIHKHRRHESDGLAQNIFDIWKKSTDKKAVARMFYEFTGIEFDDYLIKCKKKITR